MEVVGKVFQFDTFSPGEQEGLDPPDPSHQSRGCKPAQLTFDPGREYGHHRDKTCVGKSRKHLY